MPREPGSRMTERKPQADGLPSAAFAPPGLLRSAGFRFAVLFAALFATAAVALVAVLWWATAGALDRQTDAAIRADITALTERWREAGATGLADAIEERLATDVENDQIYLLREAGTDRRLAGNLDRWPPEANGGNRVWFHTRVLHDGIVTDARVFQLNLPGLELLVGRDETEQAQLRRLLTEGVLWASGSVIILALFGAWLMRHILLRRLQPSFDTIAAIAGGDLSRRVATTGRGDEFESLALTLNAMLDRIHRLMEGVRGVSDAIAHDLRTPIARARAKLEDALDRAPNATTPEGAALRAAVAQGIADLDGISRIFQALLRIAEAEAGARRAAFASFDLTPVLADVADFYGAAAEARGQRLIVALPPHLEMLGDRDLLLQAVANLLDNAIKFTPAEGTVNLTAQRRSGWLEVVVCDDGPGISAEDRSHAGQRFFRADKARATPGSGLGLSLVQAVAHLHGGDLLLSDARPDREPPGLRAVIRLPGPAPRAMTHTSS